MNNERKGCLSRVEPLITVIAGIATIVGTVIVTWDIVYQAITNVQNGVTDFSTALFTWLSSEVRLSVWVFFLIMFIVALDLRRRTGGAIERVKRPKRDKYRDLWLLVRRNRITGQFVVVNRLVSEAKCGQCGCRIVATDARDKGPVSYLICENGHHVGNETKHEDFLKEIEEMREQAKRERQEREEIRKKVEKDLAEGRMTQEEYQTLRNAPGVSRTAEIGRFSHPP